MLSETINLNYVVVLRSFVYCPTNNNNKHNIYQSKFCIIIPQSFCVFSHSLCLSFLFSLRVKIDHPYNIKDLLQRAFLPYTKIIGDALIILQRSSMIGSLFRTKRAEYQSPQIFRDAIGKPQPCYHQRSDGRKIQDDVEKMWPSPMR